MVDMQIMVFLSGFVPAGGCTFILLNSHTSLHVWVQIAIACGVGLCAGLLLLFLQVVGGDFFSLGLWLPFERGVGGWGLDAGVEANLQSPMCVCLVTRRWPSSCWVLVEDLSWGSTSSLLWEAA